MDQQQITPSDDLNSTVIPRCPKCTLIPSLKLNYKEDKPFIDYECENKHKDNISLEDYINNLKDYSLKNKKCVECNKTQNIKEDFFYCCKCEKFICYSCTKKHQLIEEHNVINMRRYDSLCKIHFNTFCFYCIDCKQNICIYCKSEHEHEHEHETHHLIDLSKFNFSKVKKQNIDEDIKNYETIINNLDIVKQKIIALIDNLKKSSELEMKFLNILLKVYKNEEKMNNINYNIIQNYKNFKKIFKLNKIDNYEKVNKEGNKFISFIENIKNIQLNSFNNNFKIFKNHNAAILYLSILKDGRLASSSSDNSLNIYNMNSFELDLSIKEHQCGIPSFTEINDNKIITCSDDNSMKLIKIEKNKYNIEQTIKEHTKNVRKIIEIKENEFISVSYERTMKVWEFNKEKQLVLKKNIIFQNKETFCNILKINNNEFVTYSGGDKNLKFWNTNDYSNITIISNVELYWTLKTLCLLDNDILCAAGDNSKGFYLISISNHQIIKNITGPKSITSMNICPNGLLLCSITDENGNNNLVKYFYNDFNLEKMAEKEKAHLPIIYSVVELNDDIIASGGEGKQIKLWKY